MMVEVTISLAAAEDVIFETARTYGGPLPNGLINSITLALSKLPPAEANNAALQSELDARAATIEALEKRVAELEGAALVEVPVTEAVTGEEYLSLMKHGWMSGQWDADDHTLCAYYWSDMEWYPNRLFHLPKLKEPTQ